MPPEGNGEVTVEEKLRALVVDDDPELRAYVARCLTTGPRQTTVLEAGDGAQALETIRTGPVHVVLTDIVLPGIDGLTLCRRLDESPELGTLPVLVISGDADSLAEARTYIEGRPDRAILRKPFNTTSLQAALGKLLEKANQ